MHKKKLKDFQQYANLTKILVIDDEPDIRELLTYNLEKSGFDVIQGCNGHEAIELTRKELPQLIVMDVMMPLMDGIEASKIIRADKELKQPIILFLTARSHNFAAAAVKQAKANDFIVKPVPPKTLVNHISRLLA